MRFIQELNTMLHSCNVYCLREKLSVCASDFEFYGILEGNLLLTSKELTCREGTVFILPPGSQAAFTPEKQKENKACVFLRLTFSAELFLRVWNEDSLYTGTHCFSRETELLTRMIKLTEGFCFGTQDNCYRLSALILSLLGTLSKLLPQKEASLPVGERMTKKQERFLLSILTYVSEHYREDISLSAAAAHFQVTPQYLASFFKKLMHVTFHSYLLDFRLRKGRLYLAYTRLPLKDICRETGLHDTDALKNYAASHPIDTLVQHCTNSCDIAPAINTTSAPPFPIAASSCPALTPEAVKRYISRSKAPMPLASPCEEATAYAEVKVSFETPFSDSFRRLINLGYASGFLGIRIFNQLIRTQEEIGFSYGRICRLFDLTAEYTVGKKTIFDYNRIFRLFDLMIEHDMLPFIELSNKLFRIQLNLLETVHTGLNEDTASYYDRLTELLPGFIRACINRYGQECFDNWRFEISYTNYDLADSADNFPLMKYVRYFCKIRKIIRSFSSACAIGGPGFNYWNAPQRLAEILNLLASSMAMPDFVTAYVYPLTRDDADAALSENENLTEERLKLLHEVTHSRYPDMEIWITEFNSNLSSRNLLNDSSYQSAYLTKTLSAAARLQITAMGYYMLSDVPLRYVDSTDMLFGGWGLFSDKDIPKPSYHAYSLMARLGKHLLANQSPYLLTCNSDSSFQCLFFHYEHITPAFCRKNVAMKDLLASDALFCPKPADSVEFCIQKVRCGTYLVREYVISKTRSNVLSEWERTGCLNLSGQEDILALKTRSLCVPEMYTIEVRPGTPLIFRVTASHHEVRLLEIDLHSSSNTT